jgi:EmrB/QacA subfamily drug resistance transporter
VNPESAPPSGASSGGGSAELARWRAFPPLAIGVVMATLDVSVVNIALPTLSRVFGVPLTSIEWVVLSYVVTITGLLLTFGRLADRLGRRRIYGMGLAVFTLASALCAAAPSAGALIAARALQGLGAAMMSANSFALLVSSFAPEERGRVIGAFGAMVGIGLSVGTPLGGLIIRHLSWRWLFLLNLPLGTLAWFWLRRGVPPDAPSPSAQGLDLPSTITWCAALVSLMLALSRGPEFGWGSPGVWPLYPLAIGLMIAFAVLERRAREPLLPARLLQGPLGIAVSLTLIAQALSISVGFHLPLFLEDVFGFDAARSGQWMAMMPVAALVCAPIAGRIADRFGTRRLSSLGLVVTATGFWALSGVGVRPDPTRVLGGMALVGMGQGLFTVPNASALMALVPVDLLGFASGLQATMRNLGFASGAAVTAALVASSYAHHGGGHLNPGHALGVIPAIFTLATHDTYLVLGVVALLAAGLAWGVPEGSARRARRG